MQKVHWHVQGMLNVLETCLVIARKQFVWYLVQLTDETKLDGSNLNYVAKFKYLGHIIDNRLCDDLDIEREIKKFIHQN